MSWVPRAGRRQPAWLAQRCDLCMLQKVASTCNVIHISVALVLNLHPSCPRRSPIPPSDLTSRRQDQLQVWGEALCAAGFVEVVGGGCPPPFWDKTPKTLKLTHRLSADHLVEAGSVGDGSPGNKVPEPVETCGFCFPGHGSTARENKSCHSTSHHAWGRAAPSHFGICSTGSAGAIPSPDDGHFKIICSPSQEKTPMV